MRHTLSKDGTRIAFERSGTGPVLLIAGGALADHHFYAPLAAELEREFTVFNFDRRGRGMSGDTQPYHVQREIEDLAALIDQANSKVFLYGHSAGAVLALRAAAAGLDIVKLVLADPPFTPCGDHNAKERAEFARQTDHVEALARRGDARGSASYFLGTMGIPQDDIEELLNSPAGAGMIDCARALRYEYAMLGDGLVPLSLAAQVTVPTTILTGDDMLEAATQLARAMPGARVLVTGANSHEMSAEETAARLKEILIAR
jgi:pimeloyl-ACP methyl ester carboxylesterase